MSVIEDVWVQLFALLLIISGIFSLHYMLRRDRGISASPSSQTAAPASPVSAPLPDDARAAAAQVPAPAAAAPAPKIAGRWVVAAQKGGDVDFTSLGEALSRAVNGDVIILRPGTYDASLLTSKSLTITGGGVSPDQVILTNSINPTFAVGGGWVVMENMTISNTSRANYAALSVYNASLVLRNVKVTSSGYGLRVQDADLEVSDSELEGVITLSISGKSKVKLTGVSLTSGLSTIKAEGAGAHLQIESSSIRHGGGVGLEAGKFASVSMSGTTISGNRYVGVMINSGAEVRIAKSRIEDNRECGAFLTGGGKLILEQVSLARNKCGVSFAGPGTLEAWNSGFSQNSMGAVAIPSSLGDSAVVRGSGNIGLLTPGEKPARSKKRAKAAYEEEESEE
jgi:hypothetical protein